MYSFDKSSSVSDSFPQLSYSVAFFISPEEDEEQGEGGETETVMLLLINTWKNNPLIPAAMTS